MFEDSYLKAINLHHVRLRYSDEREHCVLDREGNPRANPYLDPKQPKIREQAPHPDYDLLSIQWECALKIFDQAEAVVLEMLASRKLIAFGFESPADAEPKLIPAHHWYFMEVDFDESTAKGEDLQYVGIKAIAFSELSEEEQNSLGKSDLGNVSDADEETQSDTDPFVEYRQMENLTWGEVSISLVAGDLIEISARGKVKRVSYAHMGLVDKRIDKGILNRQGTTLLAIAFQERSKDSQYKKHVSRLRGQLKSLFGINKNPFHPSNFPNLHFPIFELNDYRDKADQRAKERASRRTESYDDSLAKHQIGESLSSDLEERTEEYPFQDDLGESDEANEWLKNH
jgi:hypothetical protein